MNPAGKFQLIIRDNSALLAEAALVYQKKICDIPLIYILANRVDAIGLENPPIFITNKTETQVVKTLQQIGWRVISRNAIGKNYFKAFCAIYNSDAVIFADIQNPFIDPSIWRSMMNVYIEKDVHFFEPDGHNVFLPQAIIKRSAFFWGSLRYFFSKKPSRWLDTIRQSISPQNKGKIKIDTPPIANCLTADLVSTAMIKHFGGPDLSMDSIQKLISGNKIDISIIQKTIQDELVLQRESSSVPYKENFRLAQFEAENNIPVVRSFPSDIAITITNKCNANCVFCSYGASIYPRRDCFSLEDFKKMTWLKYVTKLGMGGGLGEPLAHSDFLSIFRYLSITYPHLILRILTNGTLLNREHCWEFAGALSRIRISMNAATPETWVSLMRMQGFEKLCQSISMLSSFKKKKKTDKPEIILMMVVNNQNIHETVQFAELAHSLGANAVNYSWFSKAVMETCDMPIEASVYFNKKETDAWMGKAKKRAQQLGLGIMHMPLPFEEKEEGIFMGSRESIIPQKCIAPWKTCFLINSRAGDSPNISFCCSGVQNKIPYDSSDLDETNFLKIWNHPVIRNIRKTVNTENEDAMCRFCRTVDQDEPHNFDLCKKSYNSLDYI